MQRKPTKSPTNKKADYNIIFHSKISPFISEEGTFFRKRGNFPKVVLVAMSDPPGERRGRRGRRKSQTEEPFQRLRPTTSLSKTSTSILENFTEEAGEEMDEVPFLPSLALPDSPTPPPSRPSSTLPPLPQLGVNSPEKRQKVKHVLENLTLDKLKKVNQCSN